MIKSDSDVSSIKAKVVTDLDADPGVLVQTGATLFYGVSLVADGDTDILQFVQLFNAAALASVTLGTTAPDAVIAIPGGPADYDYGVTTFLPKPMYFPLGLVAFATQTPTGNDAGSCSGSIFYA